MKIKVIMNYIVHFVEIKTKQQENGMEINN